MSHTGAIIRYYVPHEEFVEAELKKLVETIKIIREVSAIQMIDVLVWQNPAYRITDCGYSFERLKKERLGDSVFLHKIDTGGPFCELLNYGLKCQIESNIDRSFILSYQARNYLTKELWNALTAHMERGSLVSGYALPEVESLVLRGYVQNTFALWDTHFLQRVGLFDERAEKRELDSFPFFAGGCEEFFPLSCISEQGIDFPIGVVQGGSKSLLYDNAKDDLNRIKFMSKEERISGYYQLYSRGDLDYSNLTVVTRIEPNN